MKKSNLRYAIAIFAMIFGFAACQNDATKMYKVTVSGDIEHGSVTADKTSVQEGDIVSLTVTADDGYSLEELSVKDSSDNLITLTDNTFAMPASDVTVNASFAKYFTVTYKSEHGTAPAAISVKENTALTAEQIAALSAEGFTFDAWYEGETKVEAGYKVTKSVTLTAKWEESKSDTDEKTDTEAEPEVVKFTVTYESAKGTAPVAISVEENADLTAEQIPTLSAEGFKFLGWYIGDTQVEAGYKVTKVLTLTAKWIAQYTVSYTSAYATAPVSFTVDDGTALTAAQLPSLTESGFTFGGWFDGTTKVEAGYEVTKTLTLTAKWEENSLPLVLWNSRDEENNIVWKYNTYTLESSGSYTKGIQLFDYKDRNNSLEITNPPLCEASNLPFCFSDDIVYFVQDNYWIVGYKKDGTGFKEVFKKDICELYTQNQPETGYGRDYIEKIESITYYDQYLYFYFKNGWDNLYLGRLHLDESDENALSYTDIDSDSNITAMGIYKNDSELNLIYVSYENYNKSSECIKIPIKEDPEFLLDQANSVSLYTMSSDDSVRKISDLQVIGDTCYLLLMEYLPSIDYGNINNYYLSDGVKTLLHTCTGGIIKINLKTGTVEKWKNGSEVFGEYKFNGSFYEYDSDDSEYKEKTNSSITAIPPLEQANNYFYGPVKFIAKKPDALVIADDGIYIDAEIDEDSVISKLKKFKNMNRMVTLDLKNELMSAVDVNVSFCTSVEYDSCWICINCQD